MQIPYEMSRKKKLKLQCKTLKILKQMLYSMKHIQFSSSLLYPMKQFWIFVHYTINNAHNVLK
jgi:hypothetical protein